MNPNNTSSLSSSYSSIRNINTTNSTTSNTSAINASLSASWLLKKHSIYGFEEKIIIDWGERYILIGLSGECRPRFRLNALDLKKTNISINDKQEILQLFKEILYQKLMVGPKKIYITENILITKEFKNNICHLLLTQPSLQIPLLSFLPHSLMAIKTTGMDSGLIVDCGYNQTRIIPIYNDCPLYTQASIWSSSGYLAIQKRFIRLMTEHGQVSFYNGPKQAIPKQFWNNLSSNILEDLIVRLCFLPYDSLQDSVLQSNQQQIQDQEEKKQQQLEQEKEEMSKYLSIVSSVEDIPVLEGAKLTVPGVVRTKTVECLFEPDEEGKCISSVFLDCLLNCNLEIRAAVIKNILCIGGIPMIIGFKSRFIKRTHTVLSEKRKEYASLQNIASKLTFTPSMFQPNIIGWVGASLMTSTKVQFSSEISRQEFINSSEKEELFQISDWSNVNKLQNLIQQKDD